MESSIDKASKRLGFLSLRSQQKRAIASFLEGNDVFVSLPTGSGKSLCFALLPFAFDNFLDKKGSIAIVVSPLISLMKDQVYITRTRTAMHLSSLSPAAVKILRYVRVTARYVIFLA